MLDKCNDHIFCLNYASYLFGFQFCSGFQGCKSAKVQLITLALISQPITVVHHYSFYDKHTVLSSLDFSGNENYILSWHDPCTEILVMPQKTCILVTALLLHSAA